MPIDHGRRRGDAQHEEIVLAVSQSFFHGDRITEKGQQPIEVTEHPAAPALRHETSPATHRLIHISVIDTALSMKPCASDAARAFAQAGVYELRAAARYT